jgi:hypothetical protein
MASNLILPLFTHIYQIQSSSCSSANSGAILTKWGSDQPKFSAEYTTTTQRHRSFHWKGKLIIYYLLLHEYIFLILINLYEIIVLSNHVIFRITNMNAVLQLLEWQKISHDATELVQLTIVTSSLKIMHLPAPNKAAQILNFIGSKHPLFFHSIIYSNQFT